MQGGGAVPVQPGEPVLYRSGWPAGHLPRHRCTALHHEIHSEITEELLQTSAFSESSKYASVRRPHRNVVQKNA